MGCISWNGHHIKPDLCSFTGNDVLDADVVSRFIRPGHGLEHITGPSHCDADFSVRQVIDVVGGVEITVVRTHFHHLCFHLFEHFTILTIGISAKVSNHDIQNLIGRVQDSNPTVLKFCNGCRIKQ